MNPISINQLQHKRMLYTMKSVYCQSDLPNAEAYSFFLDGSYGEALYFPNLQWMYIAFPLDEEQFFWDSGKVPSAQEGLNYWLSTCYNTPVRG